MKKDSAIVLWSLVLSVIAGVALALLMWNSKGVVYRDGPAPQQLPK